MGLGTALASSVSAPSSWDTPEDASQEPAGRPNTGRSGSWALTVPEGAYAAVSAWTSGAGWFDALMDRIQTAEGRAARAGLVSAGTLLAVARADWLTADVETGRGVTTSHETVAERVGMSKRQVQRARDVISSLGFAVTIVYGRYLTTGERSAAHEAHGGDQVRAASVRALTMPTPAVDTVHLPAPRRGDRLGTVLKSSPKRASAQKVAAPRPPAAAKRKNPGRRRHVTAALPRPVDLQRFAARLVDGDERDTIQRRLPWVLRSPGSDRDRHIGALCDVLDGAGIDPARWRPRELVETIDRWHDNTGRRTLAGTARDPLRYLAWQLATAIDPAAPTPGEEFAIRQARRATERAERERERAAERERVAQIDRAEVGRIIAQMRADAAASADAARRLQRRVRLGLNVELEAAEHDGRPRRHSSDAEGARA